MTIDQSTASATELSRYTVANGASTAHACSIRPDGLPLPFSRCNGYRFYGVREHAERHAEKLTELEAATPGITQQIRMRVRVEELGEISDDQFERWLKMGAQT